MGEISWGRAFGYALRYILYIIAWVIIGGIIAVAGIMMIAGSVPYTGSLGRVAYNSGALTGVIIPYNFFRALIGGIVLIIIGWIIAFFGSMASYFKIMSKLIVESTPPTSQQP